MIYSLEEIEALANQEWETMQTMTKEELREELDRLDDYPDDFTSPLTESVKED